MFCLIGVSLTSSYGSHPVYMEHRYDPKTRRSKSHGVFHFGYGCYFVLRIPASDPT